MLFDVDNTLLNTDLVVERLRQEMTLAVGDAHARRFWQIYEEIRFSGDSVNIPETLERFSVECADLPAVNRMSDIIYGFEFAGCVFEGAFEAIDHAWQLGTAAILSDGDQLWQRHKIIAAGLDSAVQGRVLVQKHKEREIGRVPGRFPADHYVVVDDKLRLLAAMKRTLGDRLTTVHVCQGKYAAEPGPLPADLSLASISEFMELDLARLCAAA